jgi:hypothetical protein
MTLPHRLAGIPSTTLGPIAGPGTSTTLGPIAGPGIPSTTLGPIAGPGIPSTTLGPIAGPELRPLHCARPSGAKAPRCQIK